MNIRKKENCREGGQRSFAILTADFASLQARLASIDTFYNESNDQPIIDMKNDPSKPDQTLYNVYKDGSDMSDLHSVTGFGTFVGSVHMKGIHVHDDVDNKDYVFAASSKCRIKRGDEEKIVTADELQPFDHIIEYLHK